MAVEEQLLEHLQIPHIVRQRSEDCSSRVSGMPEAREEGESCNGIINSATDATRLE